MLLLLLLHLARKIGLWGSRSSSHEARRSDQLWVRSDLLRCSQIWFALVWSFLPRSRWLSSGAQHRSGQLGRDLLRPIRSESTLIGSDLVSSSHLIADQPSSDRSAQRSDQTQLRSDQMSSGYLSSADRNSFDTIHISSPYLDDPVESVRRSARATSAEPGSAGWLAGRPSWNPPR